jgi:hypothetical protein
MIKTLQRLPREDVVLIGGYAVNAYVPPRFSIDCDLVVLGSSSKLESLLREDGFRKVAEGDVSYGGYVRYEMEKIKVSFDLLKSSVVDRETGIVFEDELFKKYSAERTTVGRSVPTRITMRIVDPELLFAMKFVSGRRQDVRDMFMLAGADLNWDLVSKLVSAKCGRLLTAKRSHSIRRDVQSKSFRDSLHGPYGKIPDERFELCRRRLAEFLKIANTFTPRSTGRADIEDNAGTLASFRDAGEVLEKLLRDRKKIFRYRRDFLLVRHVQSLVKKRR